MRAGVADVRCNECGLPIDDTSKAVRLTFPEEHYVHPRCEEAATIRERTWKRVNADARSACGMGMSEWLSDLKRRWSLPR